LPRGGGIGLRSKWPIHGGSFGNASRSLPRRRSGSRRTRRDGDTCDPGDRSPRGSAPVPADRRRRGPSRTALPSDRHP
jgi:hypothetical protein